MKLIPTTLGADLLTYSSNATKTVDLPRNHRIQRILLELSGTLDTSGSAGITDDSLNAILKAVRVRRNGTDSIRNLPAKYIQHLNYFDQGRRPEFTPVTSNSQADAAFRAVYCVDFRRDRKNPFDVIGALDAKRADSLKLEVDWGTATDIGSGVSDLQNTQVKATIVEAQMSPEEEARIYGGRDLLEYQSYVQKTVDAAYSDHQFRMNAPSGNILEKMMIVARSAGARSDALVTRYRVQQYTPAPVTLQAFDWKMSQDLDRLDYNLQEAVEGNISWEGVSMIDFEDIGHLDMRGAKEGDVNVEFTTAAPSGTTDITLVNREWVPQNAARKVA